MKKYITSESVSMGHPDKIADQISDALLDAYLSIDAETKAGIETLIKDNVVVLGGEICVNNKAILSVNVENTVKDVIRSIGYTKENHLDPENIKIINLLGKQSPEINNAVVKTDGEIGSGDQGIMFGFATNETDDYMPLDIHLAKYLLNGILTNTQYGPDAKSQITLVEEDGVKKIDSILISTMHSPLMNIDDVRVNIASLISNLLTKNTKYSNYFTNQTKVFINPAGSWHIGGPISDCGLTGRKIVVDQYGANCPVGGGAFSGKDGSKTDRSAAYLARYIAKNIVATGLYSEAKIELSYMIGLPHPSSIRIVVKDLNGLEIIFNEEITNKITTLFPLTPKSIIDKFSLKSACYYNTAKFGHFGIGTYPWEQLDVVNWLVDIVKGVK